MHSKAETAPQRRLRVMRALMRSKGDQMYKVFCYGAFGRQEFGIDYPTLAAARAAKARFVEHWPHLRYLIRKSM